VPANADSPVVVAYDGSDGAKAAIDRVASLVPARPVLVVSVWESLARVARGSLIALPADVAAEALEKLDRGAEQRAAGLAEEGAERARALGLSASAVTALSDWNVFSAILDVAEQHDAALVAVGSRGLSGIKSVLLGSISSAIVHHSPRPVLVVRPAEA
jgi:nucleotide-binding universal stress UspA family protein